MIESQTDYLFWIKLSKQCTGNDNELLIGTVYVPPMNSRFYSDETYELFENDIADMCNRYPHLYLFGDFNAQTAELQDYTECDDFLANMYDFDNEAIQFFDQKKAMESYGINV